MTQVTLLKPAAAAQIVTDAVAARDTAAGHEQAASGAEAGAIQARTAAETARDAAFGNADVYADTTAGLAATAQGEQFQVADGEEIIRYRHDAGPSATEVARYPAAMATYLFAGSLGTILAALGQVSKQVNGGQVTVKGGTLADPALRIGTVGIYSAAADTLSISIADTEVARFTSTGLSVLGGTIGSL